MRRMVKAKGQGDKGGREDHRRRQELECGLEVFDELLRRREGFCSRRCEEP